MFGVYLFCFRKKKYFNLLLAHFCNTRSAFTLNPTYMSNHKISSNPNSQFSMSSSSFFSLRRLNSIFLLYSFTHTTYRAGAQSRYVYATHVSRRATQPNDTRVVLCQKKHKIFHETIEKIDVRDKYHEFR